MAVKTMTVDELRALLESDRLFACLDVRERGEFAQEQIEGITPLPRGTIEYRVATMVPGHDIPIAVLCDDGQRSALTAQTLDAMGYTDVRVVEGGLEAWRARGLPTVSGWGMRGKEYGERIGVDREVPEITAEELAERRRRGEQVTVVDVRTDEEFLRGHVPGARHIPGGQLLLELPSLPQSPKHTLVISCAGRTRGILGAYTLRRAGLTNVVGLLNGGMGWRLAGYELESGAGGYQATANSPAPRGIEEATERLAREEGIRTMSVAGFDALRESGNSYYAVDIRVPAEYSAGHVPGSISIPAGQFALQHENFLAVRNAPLVILADDAIRPVWAAAQCQGIGFPHVFVLEGGIGTWVARGHDLETGPGSVRTFGLEAARSQVSGIGPSELQALQASDPSMMLLDVRGSGDFALGHISGARWLARGRLELDVERVVPGQDTPLVTVCDSGARSALAAATLQTLGYRNVRFLDGGLPAWRSAGLPVVDGLEGADVPREVAQDDAGSTQWTGPLARTPADMHRYLSWEEALAHR